jgi:hypothetical protein
MRPLIYAGVAISLGSWLGWSYGAGLVSTTNPQDGKVRGETYTSDYFDLSYRLPPGWTEGLAGPDPSPSGYYVLRTFLPRGELTAAILIAAQDIFFTVKPIGDTAAMTNDVRQAMSQVDGMTIDHEPSEMRVAGRPMHRVDFSGVGLYRAMFTTEIRCHLVSFNLTARDPELLARLALTLNGIFPSRWRYAAANPVCIKDYAAGENVLHRVEPAAAGPKFTPVPVRIIIGADGGVKHVHVIRASNQQRKNIEDALVQWKFKPHRTDGRAVAVETGLSFTFTSTEM